MRIFLIVSLLVFNITHAQYGGTQDYGGQQGGGYGQQDQTQEQGKPAQGKTGLGRTGLLDSMDISDKTKLDEGEKCKSKCDMIFIQCYRIQTDRGKCYSSQQECLGKCPGGGEAGASSDYGSPPSQSGGVLEFGN
jgi:hypothetical protein